MTPEQIRLVRSSFTRILPISDEAARLFYARLFEIAPHLRPLFASDMSTQGKKLMLTLTAVVRDLDNLERLQPMAVELARRHVHYGVQDAHYPIVGAALIHTLAAALGAAFTAETRAAWQAAFGTLSAAMISGARAAA